MTRAQRITVAAATTVGQLVFVGGWLVVGVLEGHGYSPARDDISDLAALTAHHATAFRLTLAVSGALTIAFGVSLRRTFGGAAWLVALSLPALDNLTDVFFRLDCRAADAGCSFADATASWHGKLHVVCFVVAAIPTVVAPFALSRRMRRTPGWVGLARPTRRFGYVVIAALVVTVASSGTPVQGLTQRGTVLVVVSGIVALAWRVVQLADRRVPSRPVTAGR
jgi:hypothetical membrane protein